MNKLFDITGKVVVITGGTGILGKAIAKYLALEGAKVVILGRRAEAGNAIVEDIKTAGGEQPEPVRAYPCDPEKNTDCKKTGCYERGGPCKLTLNPEYAKEEK